MPAGVSDMWRLLLLFTVLPFIELYLLIQIGKSFGAWWTIGLVLFTGIVGARLAWYEGLGIYDRIQRELQSGKIPTTSMLEGLVVLICGFLLITPGIITDTASLVLLLPFIRRPFVRYLQKRYSKNIHMYSGPGGFGGGFGPSGPFDVPPRDSSDPDVIDLDEDDYREVK